MIRTSVWPFSTRKFESGITSQNTGGMTRFCLAFLCPLLLSGCIPHYDDFLGLQDSADTAESGDMRQANMQDDAWVDVQGEDIRVSDGLPPKKLVPQDWEWVCVSEDTGNQEICCDQKDEHLQPFDSTPGDGYDLSDACKCEETYLPPNGEFHDKFELWCQPTEETVKKLMEEIKGQPDTAVKSYIDEDNGDNIIVEVVNCKLGDVPNEEGDWCTACPSGKYEPEDPWLDEDEQHGTGMCEWLECGPDEFINFNECSRCVDLFVFGTPADWYVPDPDDLSGCMECPENMKASKDELIMGTFNGGVISYWVYACAFIECGYKNMWIENHICQKLCPQDSVVTEDHLRCHFCGPDEWADPEQEKCVPK